MVLPRTMRHPPEDQVGPPEDRRGPPEDAPLSSRGPNGSSRGPSWSSGGYPMVLARPELVLGRTRSVLGRIRTVLGRTTTPPREEELGPREEPVGPPEDAGGPREDRPRPSPALALPTSPSAGGDDSVRPGGAAEWSRWCQPPEIVPLSLSAPEGRRRAQVESPRPDSPAPLRGADPGWAGFRWLAPPANFLAALRASNPARDVGKDKPSSARANPLHEPEPRVARSGVSFRGLFPFWPSRRRCVATPLWSLER